MVATIDDGHRLETETLHVDLGREQEAVIEVVEEDGGVGDERAGSANAVLLQQKTEEVLTNPDLLL